MKNYKKGDQVKLNDDQKSLPWGIHIDQVFTITGYAYDFMNYSVWYVEI